MFQEIDATFPGTQPVTRSQHSIEQCIQLVAREFGLGRHEIVGQRRSAYVARPRQIIMWLAKETTTASLPMIGRALGNRDHTTIMHGIHQVERRRAESSEYRANTDEFLRRLAQATNVALG